MKEVLSDYSCPRDCSERSATCHHTCERHGKYREIAEEIRQKRAIAANTEALRKVMFKYDKCRGF